MEMKARADDRGRTGQLAELAVKQRMLDRGWDVVATNARWREGEIDLIALDRNELVFAEVKALVARDGNGAPPFSPFESITRRKQLRIRMLARRWLTDDLRQLTRERKLYFNSIRFDAFAVTMSGDGEVRHIEHLADAF